jgi:hypothetical protein
LGVCGFTSAAPVADIERYQLVKEDDPVVPRNGGNIILYPRPVASRPAGLETGTKQLQQGAAGLGK